MAALILLTTRTLKLTLAKITSPGPIVIPWNQALRYFDSRAPAPAPRRLTRTETIHTIVITMFATVLTLTWLTAIPPIYLMTPPIYFASAIVVIRILASIYFGTTLCITLKRLYELPTHIPN